MPALPVRLARLRAPPAPPEVAPADGTYWHILPPDGRLAFGDGREVIDGEWLTVDYPLEGGYRGLHAAACISDAIAAWRLGHGRRFPPDGAWLCRVQLGADLTGAGCPSGAYVSSARRSLERRRLREPVGPWIGRAWELSDQELFDSLPAVRQGGDGGPA